MAPARRSPTAYKKPIVLGDAIPVRFIFNLVRLLFKADRHQKYHLKVNQMNFSQM